MEISDIRGKTKVIYIFTQNLSNGTKSKLICFCPVNEIEKGRSYISDGFNPLSDLREELGTYFL